MTLDYSPKRVDEMSFFEREAHLRASMRATLDKIHAEMLESWRGYMARQVRLQSPNPVPETEA